MIVTRLVCDGCGTDSELDRRDWPDSDPGGDRTFRARGGHWFLRNDRHYCPTCRRAVETANLRTALIAPRKGTG